MGLFLIKQMFDGTPGSRKGDWELDDCATENSGRAGRVSGMVPAKRLLMEPIVFCE